jgi:hypothetical protein
MDFPISISIKNWDELDTAEKVTIFERELKRVKELSWAKELIEEVGEFSIVDKKRPLHADGECYVEFSLGDDQSIYRRPVEQLNMSFFTPEGALFNCAYFGKDLSGTLDYIKTSLFSSDRKIREERESYEKKRKELEDLSWRASVDREHRLDK